MTTSVSVGGATMVGGTLVSLGVVTAEAVSCEYGAGTGGGGRLILGVWSVLEDSNSWSILTNNSI